MSNKSDGNQNTQSAKVVKLGLNISVTGDPDADFEIVLDDKDKKGFQTSSPKEGQCFDVLQLEGPTTNTPKYELEKTNPQEITHSQSTGAIPKQNKFLNITQTSSDCGKMSASESGEASSSQDTSILSKIKSTMEHFEKFSDHIKEIPRLRNRPLATSTPFSDKYNSKSESSLLYSEHVPPRGKYSHFYDCHSRKDYFKSSVRCSPPNIFLKPLPGEDYYKRGIYTRFFDFEPYRHYGSDISLNKTSEYKTVYGKYDVEKYEGFSPLPEPPSGILKKSDSESGDKQSTSSADSIKDIKIYQSGGILIMQNFKENMDPTEKKEMSEFSAKLIENCNKLKMEASCWSEDKPGNLSEETKNSGKMVQFDLSSFEGHKSKSGDSSFNLTKEESSGRMESSESTSDCMKNKDSSPQGTSQSQDLTSLSTQENDSFMSNPAGLSPTCAISKKLEWDSGADVGYLNLDLSKENLSTIEKIVLKGLSSDGLSEENIVYEKKTKSSSKIRLTFAEDSGEDIREESGERSGKKEGRTVPATQQEGENKSVKGDSERKRKRGRISSAENSKGESRTKIETDNSKTETKPSPKETSTETEPEKKSIELTDKSVNVNTLFENLDWETPPQRISKESARTKESHTKSSHRRSSHSPKAKVSKSKSRPSSQRLLRTPKKPTSHITGPLVTSYFDMGNPKKVYKKVEASPVLNEAELSREVEEIIIDQRFKIKNVASGRESTKETEKGDSAKESKSKSRPISASSSSNNTVLPKSDNGENVEEKSKKSSTRSKFADQIIQTSDYDRESVGVQAFASQVSGDCDLKSFRKSRENVNTSSKNIQAFGLNCSLPKQLEHPVGTDVIDNQNTKSTQFFGGALNSLPNYHSNLVTKPGESCGRIPNVLKTKRNSEIIRVKEENEKNILANDPSKPVEESKNTENKENLITQKSSNSKRSRSNASGKNEESSEKKESERESGKRKPKSISVECSDDVSSLVLTSEVLKVHGDSIDRNIIQDKYFQSQLDELEKREMISRSTSMEMQFQMEGEKEFVTTACQYSPQSRGTSNEGQEGENDSFKGNSTQNTRKRDSPEQFRLSESECANAEEEGFGKSTNQDQNLETGESLPSSTQTAHSWVPGMQNSHENSTGVGKARSFEYLPGHIYESSGNLREELPSETEQNLITSCSSDSDTARGSVSNDRDRDSEGRHTLVLENSMENSHDSDDRLKILDENLKQLNSTVLKLWEKDAQVQSVTQSLLANFCAENGSGDWLPLGGAETSKTEVGDNKDLREDSKERVVVTLPKTATQTPKETTDNEFSIACQTEEKSPSSDPEKFYEERKALEKRISEEKKCQIKWIENEIHHLNLLRQLLEKQSSPVQKKKKKPSVLSATSNDTSKSEDNYQKNICPRPVTPVYGCTISLAENLPPEGSRPTSEQSRERDTSPPQYGLDVSLTGSLKNWRRVVMLPVGVQVSLNDIEDCDEEEGNVLRSHRKNSSNGDKSLTRQKECSQNDVNTQFPSQRRASNKSCTSVQADLPSPARSNKCSRRNCLCLSLSDKSYSSSKSKTYERRESPKLDFVNEECYTENGNKTSNSTDPEFLETENDPISQSDKVVTINVDEPSDLSESYAKAKSTQSTNCRCQNCPKREPSKHGMTNRGFCQSKSEKIEELGRCRCSKIQVQKSSNCNCHIIKIHGSKCCSTERSFITCKRGCLEKKTENQSCQTENEPVVRKEVIEYQEIEKVAEGPEIKKPCEVKVGYEMKKLVKEMMPSDPKVAYERIHPDKDEENVKIKTAVIHCSCKRKAEKQKTEGDDHPRHYFLRIEEAEIDESNEAVEEKKSLEVVTVTVPVKKAGKGKIYGSNMRQSRETFQENVRQKEVPSKGCGCCVGCRKSPQDYLSDSSGYRRTRAEKPQSPDRPVISPECISYEDVSYYSGGNYAEKEYSGSNQTSNEYNGGKYPGKKYNEDNYAAKQYNGPEFYPKRGTQPQSESPYSVEMPVNDGHESHCCNDCNCTGRHTPPAREIQSEYDSHKKRKNGNAKEYYDGGYARFQEERNNRGRHDGGGLPEWSSESRQTQGRGYSAESNRYNPEFYNYNKREFMTKSELRKEEQEKRRVYQPSLQECLSSNRPDFYSSAERRRQIITERAKERIQRQNSRMDCLIKMIAKCDPREQRSSEPRRIFTTEEIREQTLKRYRKLPEVTGKIADEKKKEEYRTNRLMADIFAKKLQNEALKGIEEEKEIEEEEEETKEEEGMEEEQEKMEEKREETEEEQKEEEMEEKREEETEEEQKEEEMEEKRGEETEEEQEEERGEKREESEEEQEGMEEDQEEEEKMELDWTL